MFERAYLQGVKRANEELGWDSPEAENLRSRMRVLAPISGALGGAAVGGVGGHALGNIVADYRQKGPAGMAWSVGGALLGGALGAGLGHLGANNAIESVRQDPEKYTDISAGGRAALVTALPAAHVLAQNMNGYVSNVPRALGFGGGMGLGAGVATYHNLDAMRRLARITAAEKQRAAEES